MNHKKIIIGEIDNDENIDRTSKILHIIQRERSSASMKLYLIKLKNLYNINGQIKDEGDHTTVKFVMPFVRFSDNGISTVCCKSNNEEIV
jgi:hypothetical protein